MPRATVGPWAQVWKHLRVDQDLGDVTTSKTIRHLRFLEEQGFPVFAPRRDAWRDLVERRKVAGATRNAIHNDHKVLLRLLRFHGRAWHGLPRPRRPPRRSVVLPPDDVVARQTDRELAGDDVDDLVRLAAYRIGYYAQPRAPSELAALQAPDWYRGSRELEIFSTKIGVADRLELEPFIAEWINEYLDDVRPRVVHEDETTLIVNPRTGRAFEPPALAAFLRRGRHGARACRSWTPRQMRPWGATWYADQVDGDLELVQQRLRHRDVRTTRTYVHTLRTTLRRRAAAHDVRPLTAKA